MEKIIHYCWFGGNKLPRIAKKAIKSWKKYLPEYKIMEWNESNFDINMTKFSQEACQNKKWAFISDVARVYALKNYGGIYFDIDMVVTKRMDKILENDFFIGWESSVNVAVGVMGAKNRNHPLLDKLLSVYSTLEFNADELESMTIPTIITNILRLDYNLKTDSTRIQKLKDNIVVYPSDYFYPISSINLNVNYTKNTCMIHYYFGSWLELSNKKRIDFQIFFGPKLGNIIIDILVKIKHIIKKIVKYAIYPYYKYMFKKNIKKQNTIFMNNIGEKIDTINGNDYIVFCHKNWLGTQNATKELLDNIILIEEIFDDDIVQYIAQKIIAKNIKLVIFSAFAKGWDKIINKLHKCGYKGKIKIIWHGGPSLNVIDYDYEMYTLIFDLLNNKQIDSIGLVKKSLYEFYKNKQYNVELILNTVKINKITDIKSKNKNLKIGLYASGDRWVKNFYNQLGAASMFENAIVDCIPLNIKTVKMAENFGTKITGLPNPISREVLLQRMSQNDINFYVTYTECAPLIPLESLELGIPCITSNNHHYWLNTELRDYLVVDENDNIGKIYEKAEYCLENKEKVLKLYKKWKKDYDKEVKKNIERFINGDTND